MIPLNSFDVRLFSKQNSKQCPGHAQKCLVWTGNHVVTLGIGTGSTTKEGTHRSCNPLIIFLYWISWMNSVESEFFSLYIPLSIFSQLVSWSANLLDRDFLECIEPINLPDFVERFVYVWEEYFNTPIDHLKHYFSHHFLLVQRLKVISGWEIRAFSISFLSMCTFRHMLHMAF